MTRLSPQSRMTRRRSSIPTVLRLQILNSPYMKQLDTEALMDMQNQQDRMAKNKMKQLVMQELANQTSTPYVQMRAQHDPARQAGVMRQLKSVAIIRRLCTRG